MASKKAVNSPSSHPTGLDPKHTGFTSIELIGKLVLAAIRKFWALCTTALLILMLLFWLYGSVAVFFLVVIAVCGLIYNVQDSLLYYPDQPAHARLYVESPSMYGLPYENLCIKTSDGIKINVVFIRQEAARQQTAPTVLFLHGNAGNIGHRLMNASAIYSYVGANILLVEYRGYGKSYGTPTEHGLYLDAQAAMEFLLQRTDIDTNKIIVFGRSLGGSVAIQLTSQPQFTKRIMCLIVENTFTTLPDIAKTVFDFRILSWVPTWCFKNQYPSKQRIQKIQPPTLFLSGLADNLIPPHMMIELYELSGSALKRLARFEGGTHNETWLSPGYYETINRFLAEVNHFQDTSELTTSAAAYSTDLPFDDKGTRT